MILDVSAGYELVTSVAVLIALSPIVYLIGKKWGKAAAWLSVAAAAVSAILVIHVSYTLLTSYNLLASISFDVASKNYQLVIYVPFQELALRINLFPPWEASLDTSMVYFPNPFDRSVVYPAFHLFQYRLVLRPYYNVIPQPAFRIEAPMAVSMNPLLLLPLDAGLVADGLSASVAMLISGLGALVVFYCTTHMDDLKQPGTFYASLLLFIGGMLGVVFSTNIIEFFLFWELMLIPTYILVAYYGLTEKRGATALKYFLWTTFGSAFMLVGMLMTGINLGTFNMQEMGVILNAYQNFIYSSVLGNFAPWLASTVLGQQVQLWLTLAIIGVVMALPVALILVGFAVKMAIFPLHTWLPDTYMEAPMPVTLLLSAAMTKTAAYGIARIVSLYLAPSVSTMTIGLGILAIVTAFYGGIMALTQKNLKAMLAYSSMSQMGYILFGYAMTTFFSVTGSFFHIINHGICIATWFMIAGLLLKQFGTLDFEKLGGLAGKMPLTATLAVISGLSLAGIPPLSGFASEWMIFVGGAVANQYLFLGLMVLATAVTLAYYLWAIRRIFFGPLKPGLENAREFPLRYTVPAIILVVFTVILGIAPNMATQFFAPLFGATPFLPTIYGWEQITYLLAALMMM
ncbi:MAG: NADH dehydrogenase [Candidatus Freyarchaeota archaeon]|nr:NADH dehydrogenase [Candidatus Jordarchaeia archaeon]